MAARSEKLSKKPGILGTGYLLFYNLAQVVGWTAIFGLVLQHILKTESTAGVFKTAEVLLKVFQTAAVLEIVHCAVGLVPSGVVLTATQVFSRVFLVWAVTNSVPQVQENVSVTMFILAWTITEMIRYSFYALALVGQVPYFIQWCRYTFFIILYPVGVSGELLTIYAALPHVNKTKLYGFYLPNKLNFSFDFAYFLVFIMLSYIPGFPQLYFHMLRQRKKVIGGRQSVKQE